MSATGIESPASMAAKAMKDEKIPTWAVVLIFILLSVVGSVGTLGLYRASQAQDDHVKSEARISVLESQQKGTQSWLEKLDNKIDKVLDELRRRP